MFFPRQLALLSLTTSLLLCASSSQAADVRGWVLVQEQPHTGLWNIYLSSAGMAAVNKKMGCTLVTKAPQWNVVMYNDKTKVYFLSPLSEWKGASLKAASSKNGSKTASFSKTMLVEKKPKKLQDGKILGHKASQYLTDNLASTGLKKVEFWVTPDVQAPPELKTVFSKIYGVGLSSMAGLPLKVSYIDENGKRTPVFDTKEIEDKLIPLANFTYPSSYKRVDSEIAVLMDEKGREAMSSIMDDIGEGQEGEDVSALLDSPKKKKYKSHYSNSGGLDDTTDGGEEKEPKEKETTAATNNGDWFKQVWDSICGFLRSLGLPIGKDENADSESGDVP